MNRVILSVIGAALLLIELAACGKVGSPALPPGEHATYPRAYPSSDTK